MVERNIIIKSNQSTCGMHSSVTDIDVSKSRSLSDKTCQTRFQVTFQELKRLGAVRLQVNS